MTTRPKTKGTLFTFEGIDGSGKSTQAVLVSDFLRERGFNVLLLREPGSTPAAEKIRELVLDPALDVSPRTELLLYQAARADLVAQKIMPALQSGAIVLCDRFYDSTTAYQHYGRKLPLDLVLTLNQFASGGLKPKLTFLFELPLETALARRGSSSDRLESESHAFHERVRKGFLSIARAEPARVKQIDASVDKNEIFAEVRKFLKRSLMLSE